MEYKFNLESSFNEPEDFEELNDNIATIKVYDRNHKYIDNCYIELFLTKNAMIGMGKELIRLAHEFHVGKHVHLEPPICKELIVERLGIFISPESIPMIVCCDNNHYLSEIEDKVD